MLLNIGTNTKKCNLIWLNQFLWVKDEVNLFGRFYVALESFLSLERLKWLQLKDTLKRKIYGWDIRIEI